MSKRTKEKTPSTPAATGGAYTVLARRYRSRDFDELVGQEPIARTLQNAIESGRTAHAYLFCGTRGVGKTSMARIFAKALNADDSLSERDEIANAIFRGDDLDVIEIDGASNRGIAAAKDLIAGAGLSPARCRYKIYIIDEVHALTNDAFNALLKTMEEPPAHVKFILCTTEAHKVPATIQSRCQRFDFRPIPTRTITEQLTKVLREEGVKADDAVVTRVAQLGNGSMRDALSLLDRLLAAGNDTLTMELLDQMVGLPNQSLVISLMDAIIRGDAADALTRGDELLRQGATVEQALELLLEHLRSLMVINACGEQTELLELAGQQRESAIAQAAHFDVPGLVHLIALCDAVSRNARNSAAARALFDAALVRMSMAEHFASIADVIRGGTSAPPPAGKKKELQRAPESVAPVAPRPQQAPAAAQPSVTEVKPPAQLPEDASGDTLWRHVLEHPSHSNMTRAKLERLSYESFENNVLELRAEAASRMLSSSLDELTDIIRKACGRRIDVRLRGDEPAPAEQSSSEAHHEAQNLPLVRHAMEIFQARIVNVAPQP